MDWYRNFKSKTGITLCLVYLIFTIFCVVGYSHRTDMSSVIALLPTLPMLFPVLTILDFSDINIRPVSWWLYSLSIIMTTVFLYFMGFWVEKIIKRFTIK